MDTKHSNAPIGESNSMVAEALSINQPLRESVDFADVVPKIVVHRPSGSPPPR